MTTYLLDVNLLLALFDAEHAHHEAAHAWWGQETTESWSTCAITENGFLRIATGKAYPAIDEDFATLVEDFRAFCQHRDHVFWSADISLIDIIPNSVQVRPNEITDIYLLALALTRGGKLATLDQKIPAHLIPGGTDALETIPLTNDKDV
jgi:toxin-antitoxin system PIN domain toxin